MRCRRLILLLLLVTVLVSSCREDDGPEAIEAAVANIVTFVDNTPTGAEFSFRRIDDSPLITLRAPVTIDTAKVHPGSRVYLYYIPASGDAYASGEIACKGLSPISGGKLRSDTISKYPEWNRDGVYLYSIWRSGDYINLHCRLTYDETPRRFFMMVDKDTSSNPIPQLYLVHQLEAPVNSHDRAYYASFDIRTVWEEPTCKGVDIHIANTNLTDLTVFSFRKQ